jgi:predicted RNase H-like HicB family nuclease
LLPNAQLCLDAFPKSKDAEEALGNIREAIAAWLWAEDQKAVAAQPRHAGQPEILVSV